MDNAQMHLAPAGAQETACATCGGAFLPRRSWGRFCSTRCRNAFHAAEARKEAIRLKALDLYATLAALAGHGVPVAIEAIKDLKPPVEPKALLEKAKP